MTFMELVKYFICCAKYRNFSVYNLTHYCRVDSSTTTLWTGLFPTEGCLVIFFFTTMFIEIPVFNTNIVDADQMPHVCHLCF